MKDHLIFDTTDADTILESDSVGAFVRSSDGTLIDHSTIAGAEWLNVAAALHAGDGVAITQTAGALDVNLKSPVVVDVDLDGVYDNPDNLTPDSAGAIYHTRNAAIDITHQVERTSAGAIGTIASASLATVKAIDTNSFMYALDDASGDAETLTKDSVSGGLNVHLAGSDITLQVSDAALANTAIVATAETLDVASTAQAAVASPLANRKYLFIYNNDNRQMFIGGAGVSEASGYPVSPGSSIELRAGAASPVNYVSSKVNHAIRTLELS